MDRFIIFCVGMVASVVTEVFWKGESRRCVALWGGAGMLLLRRLVLRFPFESRALLSILGGLLLLVLWLTLLLVHVLSKHADKQLIVTLPSLSYGLYRFLLIAPAYTIIEYLEARLGM